MNTGNISCCLQKSQLVIPPRPWIPKTRKGTGLHRAAPSEWFAIGSSQHWLLSPLGKARFKFLLRAWHRIGPAENGPTLGTSKEQPGVVLSAYSSSLLGPQRNLCPSHRGEISSQIRETQGIPQEKHYWDPQHEISPTIDHEPVRALSSENDTMWGLKPDNPKLWPNLTFKPSKLWKTVETHQHIGDPTESENQSSRLITGENPQQSPDLYRREGRHQGLHSAVKRPGSKGCPQHKKISTNQRGHL